METYLTAPTVGDIVTKGRDPLTLSIVDSRGRPECLEYESCCLLVTSIVTAAWGFYFVNATGKAVRKGSMTKGEYDFNYSGWVFCGEHGWETCQKPTDPRPKRSHKKEPEPNLPFHQEV